MATKTARTTKTAVQKAMAVLQKALAEDFEKEKGIIKQGDRIILPEGRSYSECAAAILRYEKEMDEECQNAMEFDCHPDDGLVAFYHSVQAQFGSLMGQSIETWFGTRPAQSLNVFVGYGETLNVPVRVAEVPGLPIRFDIRPDYDENDDDGGSLVVIASYKRLYETLVKKIEAGAREMLKNNSIFRGKAIDSRWQFLDAGHFDVSRVVYSEKERRQIEANILTPIRHTNRWADSGSSLKRGILLSGPYGTGKTLTAMLTARTCVENGWTFVNVLPGDDVVKSIRFAARFEPAVVFLEDIDSETSGERGARLNEILNTIDGVLSKSSKVMTILTTNHVEYIHQAMLRPGRLDAMIELGEMDEQSVYDLIMAVARDRKEASLLSGDVDKHALFEAAQGFVPAFIVEAVTKAKAYALRRNPEEIAITQQDVVEALEELRPQWELMNKERADKNHGFQTSMEELVDTRISPLMKRINDVYEYISE